MTNTNIVNLTPHVITLIDENGGKTVIESSGIARCIQRDEKIGELNGFPVFKSFFGEVTGLPEKEEGTVIIVSAIVAKAMAGKRDDLGVVSQTVRDEAGKIIGCRGFAVID